MIVSYILAIISFILGCIHPELYFLFIVSVGFCFTGSIAEHALIGHKKGGN